MNKKFITYISKLVFVRIFFVCAVIFVVRGNTAQRGDVVGSVGGAGLDFGADQELPDVFSGNFNGSGNNYEYAENMPELDTEVMQGMGVPYDFERFVSNNSHTRESIDSAGDSAGLPPDNKVPSGHVDVHMSGTGVSESGIEEGDAETALECSGCSSNSCVFGDSTRNAQEDNERELKEKALVMMRALTKAFEWYRTFYDLYVEHIRSDNEQETQEFEGCS